MRFQVQLVRHGVVVETREKESPRGRDLVVLYEQLRPLMEDGDTLRTVVEGAPLYVRTLRLEESK